MMFIYIFVSFAVDRFFSINVENYQETTHYVCRYLPSIRIAHHQFCVSYSFSSVCNFLLFCAVSVCNNNIVVLFLLCQTMKYILFFSNNEISAQNYSRESFHSGNSKYCVECVHARKCIVY